MHTFLFLQVHLTDGNGNISCGECDCPRGKYKCSHLAAVYMHAIHNISRTDVECTWKMPKSASKTTQSVKEMYPKSKPDYKPLKREICDEDLSWLFGELKQYGRFTGLAWLMSPEPRQESSPEYTLEEIFQSKGSLESNYPTSYAIRMMEVSEDQS